MRPQTKFSQSKWLFTGILAGASALALDVSPGSALAGQDCAVLSNLRIDNTNLLSATEVPASGDLPAYCRVLGFVRPAINFEIRLPLGWNGKFYMAGCGGLCGTVDSDRPGFFNSINFGLRRKYAVSTMDAGHRGATARDGRWAMNDLTAQMDFGQRAVTETARVTKQVIRAYYGTEQNKSYFAGCSTGGRMAAMEAWRFPGDFDGIISGAPSLDYTGLSATVFAWVTKANTGPDRTPIFPRSKIKLVQDAVAAACGDGTKEALVSDPRHCHFLAFICGENGGPLTKESFGNFFRDACNAAGVEKSAHGVRKIGATRAANNGATVAELEAIFGWEGGRMASLYTRAADRVRLAKSAMAKLDRTQSEQPIPAPSGKVREPERKME